MAEEDNGYDDYTYMDNWGPSYTSYGDATTEVKIDEGPSKLFILSIVVMFLAFIVCIVVYGWIAAQCGVIF